MAGTDTGHQASRVGAMAAALATGLFFVFVFLSLLRPVTDGDAMWHLATGRYIVEQGDIPRAEDPFSFATDDVGFLGRFSLSQYWLAQALMDRAYAAFGPGGLVAGKALVFTLTAAVLWLLVARRTGRHLAYLVVGAVSVVLLRPFVTERPQIVTFLFTAVLILLVERYRETGRTLFLAPLPVVMLAWANMHGGFIYGIVVLVAYGAAGLLGAALPSGRVHEEFAGPGALRRFLLISGVSIILSALNPNGYAAFVTAFMAHGAHLEHIMEYRSPFEAQALLVAGWDEYIYWAMLPMAGLMAVGFALKRRPAPLFLVLLSAAMSLTAIRYIALFAITALAMISRLPWRLEPPLRPGARAAADGLISAGLLAAALALPGVSDERLYRLGESPLYPVKAVEFMKEEGIGGNIFASYNTAGYLLFSLHPGARIYLDSRNMTARRVSTALRISGQFDSLEEWVQTLNSQLSGENGLIRIEAAQAGVTRPLGVDLPLDKEWTDLLDEIGAEVIVHEAMNLYSKQIYAMVLKLMNAPRWKLVYLDGRVMIFLKNMEKFRDIIAEHEKPKDMIYDQIVMEGIRLSGLGQIRRNAQYYASVGLALVLKGETTENTEHTIRKALAMDPHNFTALYADALLALRRSQDTPP